jgi:hypothetical protein
MSRLESLLSRMFGPAAFGLDATVHLTTFTCWEFGEAPRATVNAEQDTTPVTTLQTQSGPSRRGQPFERVATTADTDKDGNPFLVGVVLTAVSRKGLLDAAQAYLAVLKGY